MENTARNLLIYLDKKNNGDWLKTYADIRDKVLPEQDFTLDLGDTKVVTIIDDDYPEELKKALQPPFVIYYKGNLNKRKPSNECIFLKGNNCFKFKSGILVKVKNNKVYFNNGKLVMWLSNNSHIDAVKLATYLSKVTVLTEDKPSDLCVDFCCSAGHDFYVKPTTKPSWCNCLIKQGAYLIDRKDDITDLVC